MQAGFTRKAGTISICYLGRDPRVQDLPMYVAVSNIAVILLPPAVVRRLGTAFLRVGRIIC